MNAEASSTDCELIEFFAVAIRCRKATRHLRYIAKAGTLDDARKARKRAAKNYPTTCIYRVPPNGQPKFVEGVRLF